MKDQINVFIADDHPIFRKGMEDIFLEEEDITLVGSAADGEEAIELITRIMPQVAILDLDMPGKDGLEVTSIIRSFDMPVKVIILTMYKDEDRFNRALELKVNGYVLKENTIDEITDCIRRVANGKTYISPLLSDYLLNRINKKDTPPPTPEFIKILTPTERKILFMIAELKKSREIASELFVSIKTVENHRSNICKKLDLQGTNSLLKFAIEKKEVIRQNK